MNQADREFAVGYLKFAMESLDNPEERAGALISLRAVATEAGISRESLYRAPSPKGNPTLKDSRRRPKDPWPAPLCHTGKPTAKQIVATTSRLPPQHPQ